jgi:hypothetical protein
VLLQWFWEGKKPTHEEVEKANIRKVNQKEYETL